MRKASTNLGTCPDCGKEDVLITSQGICEICRTRKTNAIRRGKEYIPYINLSEEKKRKIDILKNAQANRKLLKQQEEKTISETTLYRIIDSYDYKINNVKLTGK